LPVEAGPPTPRAEFGRRPDAAAEIELMLVQPAAEPRRLRVTDDAGAPIGEMIFHPSDPPVRAAYASSDDTPAVPYFPEDLFEPEPEFGATEPEPLRPWIKALRNSGGARPKPVAAQAEHPAPAVPKTYLGHDLLAALAVSLMREHTALKDRIARTRVGPHAQAA